MYSYVTKELIELVEQNLNQYIKPDARAISGHSMGGHGALISAIRNPGLFKVAAAFSPISNPINCQWGEKNFTGYLGTDKSAWKNYDATELIANYNGPNLNLRIDVGSADPYLKDQLKVDNFVNACKKVNVPVNYNVHDGYDHGYFFVGTIIPDHFAHIANVLNN